jgi:mono/diheme cytochrome c family protein
MKLKLRTAFAAGILAASIGLTPAFAAKPEKNDATIAQGKSAYTTNCLSCHGEKGDGEGPAGKFLNPKPRNFTDAKAKWKSKKFKDAKSEEALFDTVTNGLPNTSMVGFNYVKEEDRWAIVYYVQSLMPKAAEKPAKKK